MSTTIETITVTRPMKVIAFTCCTITVFLMIAAVSCSDWVNSDGWREGLFVQCIDDGAPTPLPFGAEAIPGCHKAHSAGYVRGTAALIVICVLTDFFGTLLTGLGLRSTDPNKKYKYYRVAIYALLVATIALLLALIIYPVSFSKEIDQEPAYDGGRVSWSGSNDFDGDGLVDSEDPDDDNDNIPDELDDDDDGDGIPDDKDKDDDNDGIPDDQEGLDSDGDGTPDAMDNDDDGDGIPDKEEDADGDGTPDNVDNDDDNDGIPDDEEELDSDGDGTPDAEDTDDDNDGIPDSKDKDDDNDGIPDSHDLTGDARVWEFGFGYGVSWLSCIALFASVTLLICDRESEEIFYKERPVEEDEEEA
jgi:hypothetical protein